MGNKYIDIKEFRDMGLLVAINREFLHPLGLAMAINKDDLGNETIVGIIDSRDDPEGYVFKKINKEKLDKAHEFMRNKHADRLGKLGFIIQPEDKTFE